MTIKEFKFLEKESKHHFLLDKGVFLLTRQEPEYYIDLYQLDDFYVEAYFHYGRNRLVYLRAFTNMEELYPYLKQVDISPLLH
jgi:hypothetical protein